MLWNVDPWRELERMRRELDTLFSRPGWSGAHKVFPLMNVYDSQDSLVVTAELPGLDKDSVNITFSDNSLTISGTQKQSDKLKEMSIIRRERVEGNFEKTVSIPCKVESDKINASFKDGILTIRLPKCEDAKPRRITIQS